MVKCAICECNCDPSDLVGGICDECAEHLSRTRKRKERMKKLIVPSVSGQMELLEAGGPACMEL